MDTDVGRKAIALMQAAGIEIDPGLTPSEFDDIERRYAITFAPEHRAMLAAGVPVRPERFPNSESPDWPPWRDGDEAAIRYRLDAPVEHLLPLPGDTLTWWHDLWGDRPDDPQHAIDVARAAMLTWPKLVPIYSHRYMPAAPAPNPAPVLSIVGSDIIYYGSDLLDYLDHEFVHPPSGATGRGLRYSSEPLPVPPWSELHLGAKAIGEE